MAKNKILDAANGIVGILQPLETDERARAIQAALTVLGDSSNDALGGAGAGGSCNGATGGGHGSGTVTEKTFFHTKEPRTKGEELAVAARFREAQQNAPSSTREELKQAIKAARLNFDERNFLRDLENARIKGLFNRGTGKDSAVLSHYGQKYVDAMPDRDAVRALRKPKGAGGRRASRAKKPASKRARTR